jgi:hypothetical protein
MPTAAKTENRPLRWVAVLGCAALVVWGCGRAPTTPAAAPDIPAACASAFQLPAAVLTVPEPLPPIVNRSKARPEDATAWARALMRALRVEAWALANSRDDLMTSGCLGDSRAQAQLFGDETYLIGMAKRAHDTIVVTVAEVTALTLIELGVERQAIIAGDLQVPSRYAWLVTTRGPSGVLLVAPGGKVRTVIEMPDGDRARDFYGGLYQSGSWVGPLWFQQSYYSCVSTRGRSLCA